LAWGHSSGRVGWRCEQFRPMASCVSALSSIVANGHQVLPSFPPPPLFMPYGGFSPVRLEASPSPSILPSPFGMSFDAGLAIHPFLAILFQASGIAGCAHWPLAQRGLSCPHLQSLLRPDPPVWRTPPSLAFQLTLAGLCSCGPSASPSLLCFVTPSEHAATSTPPVVQLRVMVHPSDIRALTTPNLVRLFRKTPSLASERHGFRGGSFLFMLRPTRWLGLLTSPRRRLASPTGQPVYGRACPGSGLPKPRSAITTRPNHLLPRQDSHLLACQRSKAALRSAMSIAQTVLVPNKLR
jgi:hypothetical protein